MDRVSTEEKLYETIVDAFENTLLYSRVYVVRENVIQLSPILCVIYIYALMNFSLIIIGPRRETKFNIFTRMVFPLILPSITLHGHKTQYVFRNCLAYIVIVALKLISKDFRV